MKRKDAKYHINVDDQRINRLNDRFARCLLAGGRNKELINSMLLLELELPKFLEYLGPAHSYRLFPLASFYSGSHNHAQK